MTISLAVVNDYPLVVAGLQAILEPFQDRVRVAELDLHTPVAAEVDVVLHDTFASSRTFDPRDLVGPRVPKIIVFSWTTDLRHVDRALDGGADGFVSKDISPADLVDAIERVHRGERVALGATTRGDGQDVPLTGRWPGDEHGLSGRESEVLALICQGLSNNEISATAYIGVNTVKTYIRSCYRKIGAETRPQAVIWGLSHGFGSVEHRQPRPQIG